MDILDIKNIVKDLPEREVRSYLQLILYRIALLEEKENSHLLQFKRRMATISIILRDMLSLKTGIPIIIRHIQVQLFLLEMECMSITMIFTQRKTMDIDTILRVLTNQLLVINRMSNKKYTSQPID